MRGQADTPAATTLPASQPAAAETRFELTFTAEVCPQPFTGRVFLMTADRGEPRNGPSWFNTQPFFALDVTNWQPGAALHFDPQRALGFPAPLSQLPPGQYRLQAVLGLNRDSHAVVGAAGNAFSKVVRARLDPAKPKSVELRIDALAPPPRLEDTDDVKYIHLRSSRLSRFHGRDIVMRAAVGLPGSYADEPGRRYPAIYIIPGFGGTLREAAWFTRTNRFAKAGVEIVRIYLDPDCPTGHHVFADSANNGPRGAALVEELIPALESQFRLIAHPDARYLTGHSSGGWSSLWLQVAYPDFFGGVWSTSPDPVDFHAFQLVDIYEPTDNMFFERDGSLRTLSRPVRGEPLLSKRFSDMETVMGRGGQLQSFEAVFSPRGRDGQPARLWDRTTGRLDPAVAAAWRKYDIRALLEENWATLGPKLAGKLHIFCGDADTFHLERAVFRLRDALQRLNSDAYIEIIPGAGHGLPGHVQETIARQVAGQFQTRYLKQPTTAPADEGG